LEPFFSFGLHHILAGAQRKADRIVNGIDTALFDPKPTKNLACGYDLQTLPLKATTSAPCKKMGLPVDPGVPLVGRSPG
jgi:glycogen synthase